MIHPIEMESYRILETRVDLSHLDPGPRSVVERVIHASADPEYAILAGRQEGHSYLARAARTSCPRKLTDSAGDIASSSLRRRLVPLSKGRRLQIFGK